MDVFGGFLEEEWGEPLSKMFSMEDSDLMLGNNIFSPSDHIAIIERTNLEQNNTTIQNNEGLMRLPDDDVMEEILQKLEYAENADYSCMGMEKMKRKFDDTSESLKKKPRNKRSKKDVQIINNNNKGSGNGQSSTSSEEDNSNSNELINGGSDSIFASKGMKSKAPATDPQSIYARKRRERINERLRMLQNLVPNGTKVDISTMLEEAVSYVKFLQLQIKLLSSDDLWMYAPIAYNGMDMCLYQKIVPTQLPHN